MGQWNVDVDDDQDRLYAEFSGHFEEEEAAEAADAIIGAATRLSEEFDMINDLENLQIGDTGAAEELERGKEGVADNGLSTVVRILPVASSGELQYAESGEKAEDYRIETAESVTEAEAILDDQ
jgi:hypothetical protein